jgi:glycosyltransferase involved in cell wall biosynthesis
LRILFVCDYYPPHVGGAELLYMRYCEGLVNRGHLVDTVTLRHSGDLPSEEIVGGVAVHRVNTVRYSRRLFALSSLRNILEYVDKADVIHCAFFVAPFSAVPIAKLRGKPTVVTVHEVWAKMWFKFESNFWSALFNYLGERVLTTMPYNAITCCSFFTFNSLRMLGIDEDRITLIPNGVDLNLFKPRAVDRDLRRRLGLEGLKVYMFSGRPGISKGVEYLLRAAVLIKERVKSSKLLLNLVREPSAEYFKIIRLIDNLGLRDHVCLLDPIPREELPRYISLADLVVVPSLSEGFGFMAAEAGAMGKPVVATYAGSLPEVVNHEESGLLIKPGSSSELCGAVCRLLEDKEEANRMGNMAQVKVAKFDWNKSINMLEDLYMKLIF